MEAHCRVQACINQEAMVLLEQHNELNTRLDYRTEQVNELLRVVARLEQELLLMRESHDYREE